jgi:hypothetical protein
VWQLPASGFSPHPALSYHNSGPRWTERDGFVRLQTVGKGQEFVLEGTTGVLDWIRELLEVDYREAAGGSLSVERPSKQRDANITDQRPNPSRADDENEDSVRSHITVLATGKDSRPEASPMSGHEPRAIQPRIDAEIVRLRLHKLYHIERHGVFMVGHANTAKGWVTRRITGDRMTVRHGDLQTGKRAAIAYATEQSKGVDAVELTQAKERFDRETILDGEYGLVAQGKHGVFDRTVRGTAT